MLHIGQRAGIQGVFFQLIQSFQLLNSAVCKLQTTLVGIACNPAVPHRHSPDVWIKPFTASSSWPHLCYPVIIEMHVTSPIPGRHTWHLFHMHLYTWDTRWHHLLFLASLHFHFSLLLLIASRAIITSTNSQGVGAPKTPWSANLKSVNM